MSIDNCKSSKIDDANIEPSMRQAVNLCKRIGISLFYSAAERSATGVYVERYFVLANTRLSHTSPGPDKGVVN